MSIFESLALKPLAASLARISQVRAIHVWLLGQPARRCRGPRRNGVEFAPCYVA
jgi:hypothetical protein